jgi:putative RecB family exonuclease
MTKIIALFTAIITWFNVALFPPQPVEGVFGETPQKVQAEFDEGEFVMGEFDLVVTDGHDNCIVDWKTASAKWPVDKADKDLQATAFSYAFKEKYGEKPLFRFDVFTKAKTPTVNNYYTLRTDNELERFVSLANGIEKSVNSGNFYPNESGFGCAECPYRDCCKKWR